MNTLNTKAWTGGKSPEYPLPREVCKLARALFEQNVGAWVLFWGVVPEPEVIEIHRNDAVHTAWATFGYN